MDFEIDVFLPSQKDLLKELGLDENGRVQKVVDNSFMHYMKLNMPQSSEKYMVDQVRNPQGGLVTVNTPYAHYQNEGILYVDPITGKGAFYNENYGYWSRPNTKKIPSNRKLKNYYDENGGPGRGAHFVERTITNNFDDILREAQREVDKK